MHFQALGEGPSDGECERNAGEAAWPSDPIEDLPEDRRSDQAAGEVTGEINAAGRAAVRGRGAADEAGRGRLGEKRPHADEDHAQQDRREIG